MNELASTSQKRPARVTDVSQIVDGNLFAVCKAGERVALHFGTSSGIIIVRTSLKSFVEVAQAPKDHQGNPFRSTQDVLEEDAKQVPITKGSPESTRIPSGPHRYGTHGFPPEKISALRQAWADVRINGATINLSEIAVKVGCSTKAVRDYFTRFDAQADSQPDAPV